jgi:hypothetical protein
MTKKTKHLGRESGKSSGKYFTPSSRPSTGDGNTNKTGLLGMFGKVLFDRDPKSK